MTDARTFVISDIHGDLAGFETVLLDMYGDGMNLERDTLVQLGDMVDGYNASREVVATLRGLADEYPNVVVLLGNHEDFVLRAVGKSEAQSDFRAWWYQGGQATYESYHGVIKPEDDVPFILNYMRTPNPAPVGKFIPRGRMADDIEWFKTLPLWYETEDYIFVHAGLRDLPPEANKRHDMLWIREEFHDSTHDWNGKLVVYGHTARPSILVEKNKIGLDTRWRGRGCVTGVELVGKEVRTVYEGPRD